jgi:hypothetical protein
LQLKGNQLMVLQYQKQTQAIEAQIVDPVWLQIRGSAAPAYFSPWSGRLFNRFTQMAHWSHIFTKGGTDIGFLTATASGDQATGIVARPILADENLDCLPTMLEEAATWLTQKDKTAVQIAATDERVHLTLQLENAGWVKRQSWLQLVKWLR